MNPNAQVPVLIDDHGVAIMAGNRVAKPVVDMGFELQVREST
ncbi:Gluconate utilization system Gnt-I transcriptional repressor [Pseudomonas orientalis]|nr:Gluconate utilization system Gnt-I transcriptional repressor [Pseudomonas orientalis]